jgi:hypothetical protein
MKVIVAGSRGITDHELVRKAMNSVWREVGPYEVVSGMARGVDSVAAVLAHKAGIVVHQRPADWDRYGRRAGYLRNEQMAEEADVLIAIWDGKSKGTDHMIRLATKKGLRVFVWMEEGETR